MDLPSRRQRASTLALICACLAALPVFGTDAAASQVPPPLVAQLGSERRDAEQELSKARRMLGERARAQRGDAASAARVQARRDLLEHVTGLVGMELPSRVDEQLADVEAAVSTRLGASRRHLDDAARETARAQSVALDADRRIRALERASATEDERDTALGSWTFGSGGPPVSAESIDRYLASKGSPLAGSGAAFLESGVAHEVDPRLVVAIAGAESFFGITTCAAHNAWGWGCPTRPFVFRSWDEAIETITVGLREGYLDDGLESVGEIHLRYAPPNATNDPTGLNFGWADNVAGFLIEQGGDPQDVAGIVGPSR
jgi:hypothetical protein